MVLSVTLLLNSYIFFKMAEQFEMNALKQKIVLPVAKDTGLMARASSPSSIYYIPESTFNQRPSIDIKVSNVSYTVNPQSLSWWQKLSTMQLPWEWMDSSEPQQVLNNVSFSINSGQMLAIMGNSGTDIFSPSHLLPVFLEKNVLQPLVLGTK